MRIFVGNLPYNTDENRLTEVFGQYGEVADVHVVKDKLTGRSRGFAFVDMPDHNAANKAITALSNNEMDGRKLVVNEARPREENSGGGGGGSRPPRREQRGRF